MAISINLGVWDSVFAVPTCIAEEHLKIASELQLKVILFLLAHSKNTYTYEDISAVLSSHPDDIKDAVNFWIDRGVICQNGESFAPKQGISINKSDTIDTKSNTAVKTKLPRATKPDIVTAAQIVSGDGNLQALLSEIEIALSKPLSNGDTATIVMLYDTCGLPPEVIIMLVNYCTSINKGNMRTIERIGLEWADKGINSIEAAENRIVEIKRSNENWSIVSGVFGLKNVGSPTKKQLEYADVWVGKWHFSPEMLRTAYEICVDNLSKLSMSYINKILQRWNNAGIYVVEDISKLESKKSTKKKSNASYDIAELEEIQ